MKKDKHSWSMKAASVLMTLALISSCFLGGTFSKYIVTNSASDKARVAKFGVKVETQDFENLFKCHYQAHDNTSTQEAESDRNKYSVKAFNCKDFEESNKSEGDNLIAPGTYYEAGDNFAYRITGTPEVAVRVKISPTVKVDNFTVEKLATEGANSTPRKDYIPIIFKIEKTNQVSKVGGEVIEETKVKYLYSNVAYKSNDTVKLKSDESEPITIGDQGEDGVSWEEFNNGSELEAKIITAMFEDVAKNENLISNTSTYSKDYKPNTQMELTNDSVTPSLGTCKVSWYWPFQHGEEDNIKSTFTGASIYDNDTNTAASKIGNIETNNTVDPSTKDTGLGDAVINQHSKVKKLNGYISSLKEATTVGNINTYLGNIYEIINSNNIPNEIKDIYKEKPGTDILESEGRMAIQKKVDEDFTYYKSTLTPEFDTSPNISISFAVSIEQID